MHFTPVVALLAFVAATSALTTGHHVRAPHHRALAARVTPIAAVDRSIPIRKRANGKRCRPRPSSAAAITSSTSKDEPTATPATTHKADPTTSQNDPATPTTHELAPTTHEHSPTTHLPDPTTTPKPQSPTTTRQAPPATTKVSSSGSGGIPNILTGNNDGDATWYSTGLGACGITNSDSDKIAAASHVLFDTFPGYNHVNPNSNPMCGRQVKVSYQGKSVVVKLTDRCAGCSPTDLDLSPSAFSELADLGAGRVQMTWEWV